MQRKTHSLILINLVFAIGVFILAIKLLNRSKSYYNIVESTYIIVFSAITEQSVSFNCLPEGSVFLALIYNSTILIIYLTGFHLSNVECKIKSTSLSYLNVSCSFIKIYCLTSWELTLLYLDNLEHALDNLDGVYKFSHNSN